VVPRGGLEGPQGDPHVAGNQTEAHSEKPSPSLPASQNPEQLCSELSEIVSAWPSLSLGIRGAVLTLLRAVK